MKVGTDVVQEKRLSMGAEHDAAQKPLSAPVFGREGWPWGFAAGVIGVQVWPQLPGYGWLILPLLLGVLATCWHRVRWQSLPVTFAVVLGGAWAISTAQGLRSNTWPTSLAKTDIEVVGEIVDIPRVHYREGNQSRPMITRFNFRILTFNSAVDHPRAPLKARINWYGPDAPRLEPGDRWQLTVRLKPPHGSVNPGGFDYERWLLANRIRAVGYVRNADSAVRLSRSPTAAIHRFRHRFATYVAELNPGHLGGLLPALGVGIRDGIDRQQWSVLRDSGTLHLLAISGLHLSLVSGLCYLLAAFGWRMVRWLTGASAGVSRHSVGLIAGLGAAAVYAALAGFSIPTRRALLMLSVAATVVLLRRNVSLRFGFGLVLAVVLAFDPLAPLSNGFWLSFGAVGVMLYYGHRRAGEGRPAPRAKTRWGRVKAKGRKGLLTYLGVQGTLFVGLAPLLLWGFGQVSVVAILANALAIPLIGLFVVPLILLALLVYALGGESLAATLLLWPNTLLDSSWPILSWLANQPGAIWVQAQPPTWSIWMAGTGVLLILGARSLPFRMLGLAWMLPMLMVEPPRPTPGAAWVSVLDVGQGLSAVVQTTNKALLFDAGPAFTSGFNAGDAAVLPFLRQAGIRQLDAMVLSHNNADHIGGRDAVLAGIPVTKRWASATDLLADSTPCRAGKSWEWDGVRFEFLHPTDQTADNEDNPNDRSCVLRVSAGNRAMLLTADIERKAERALIERYAAQPDKLRAEALLVPHQGSKTSSTGEFIDAVSPEIGVVNTGFLNRFGHPHPDVVARYRARGIPLLNTANEGAIRVALTENSTLITPYRRVKQRYWHTHPGSADL